MEKSKLKDLLLRYSAGQCTKDEAIWVENWYLQQDVDAPLPVSNEEFHKHLEIIYQKLPKGTKAKANSNWMKVAAVLSFFVLSIGTYIYLNKNNRISPEAKLSSVEHDIAPGGNIATLTLSDGTIVSLDQIKEGEIYQDNNLRIRKTKDGQIEYIASSNVPSNPNQPTIYNQINTPNGGQYQVTLSDGSKVWLNASTTLKYPTSFSSSERVVELEGEAYFEVARSKTPFYVKTEDQRIQVLGTQFNVNAYPDELGTKTTLLEGSVKLIAVEKNKKSNQDIILKPGEEALLIKDKDIQLSKVNVKQAVAWKNGFFHFEDADLKSVMREFSRWYRVEIKFEGIVPETRLWGEISRDLPASQALSILKYYGLSFNVTENNGVSKIEIYN
jgi:transmembrane sensor